MRRLSLIMTLALALPATSFADDHGKPSYEVKDTPYTATLRSVSAEDLEQRGRVTGVWHGSPQVNALSLIHI